MVYTTHYQSPLGALLLAARGDALAGLWLEGQKYFLGSLKEPAEPMEGHPVLLQAAGNFGGQSGRSCAASPMGA